MKKTILPIILVFLTTLNSSGQNSTNPPEWAENVIWYQIFVERFNNGDSSNDPTPATTTVANMKIFPPEGWKISSWTSNWYERQPWEQDPKQGFNSVIQSRRYGGDLQGVMDKLDYLQELGITAVYFNPLNDAPWCKLWIGHDWRDFLPFMARVNGNTWKVRRIDHAPFLGDVETRKMVTEKTIIF